MRLIIISFVLCVAICALSNSDGRAAGANRGNSGAPGDEMNTNGTPRTCQSCHNPGPITCALSISLLDENSDPVTQYMPGKEYIARVQINSTSAGVNGYGFQMIALKKIGNTDLKGFKDMGVNGYKLSTIQNGRIYAEHSGVSASNTFDVQWVAPVVGTGSVNFYASGNAVNNNGLTSGDGASSFVLEVQELPTSASVEPVAPGLGMRAIGGGEKQILPISIDSDRAGDFSFEMIDLSGHIVAQRKGNLIAGEQRLELEVSALPPGLYVLHLQQKERQVVKKAILVGF
jgi:hypothetical protein